MGETNRPMAMGEPLYMENGRGFHDYRRGAYMYPCDGHELERLDLMHTIFRMVRDRRCLTPDSPSTPSSLYKAPIRVPPERVLDVGTGSGIWAIDMADMFPDANVIGVDLANVQPNEIPENVRFLVRQDFEDRWTFGQDSFDLIHLRCLNGSVSSWPALYQKVFSHLKPGEGWIEHTEINWEPRSATGEVPQALRQWWDYLADATHRGGKPLAYQPNTVALLKAQGFVDVSEQVIQLPLSEWSQGEQIWLGRWGNIGIRESFEALSLGPFTRVYNWPAEDVQRFSRDIIPLICNREHQIYNTIHIVTGRKP